MKSARIEKREMPIPASESWLTVRRLYPPAVSGRAQMLAGSVEEIADRMAQILLEKGLLR